MGLDMLVKQFSNFVPNEISNLRQVFLIILKDKELQNVPMTPWKGNLKK